MTIKQGFLLFFIFQLGLINAQESLDKLLSKYNSHSIPYISVEELKMQSDNEKVFILDAREKEEFEVSHLKNSIYVGYNNFSAKNVTSKIKDKSVPIVVYCSLGIRSENISEKLKDAGYTNIKNLYGGIFEWMNKGYSVYDSSNNETQKIHAFSKHWTKYLNKGEKVYKP
ncbi:rhodanese-like domain-containing protein [Gillisia hiemivivida]|uniref:Rhodanese-like domain-containing protein n=1 Tax=Gillisia hiemivivida TaxID=291190 RepID=A0A5C6ZPM2_9FLAO|nr:rhodanese-like domain-containing protein [Gillisia hiemivivida]TXD92371.1 rhodanese-like domain-containing protein [Gillisia hiemivivida]